MLMLMLMLMQRYILPSTYALLFHYIFITFFCEPVYTQYGSHKTPQKHHFLHYLMQ